MEDLIDITLDPDTLLDVTEEEYGEFLDYSPGSSYSNTINIRETNSDNKLRNKIFFENNNIINFPYEKKRDTQGDDLDISVILLIHGGSNRYGNIIKKNHNFWNHDNLMFNCKGEEVIGIKANSVRMYNDIGFNVNINDNIYKILIGIFYFNSLICLILSYLILNLFKSRKNDKIYPYKKLYTIGKQKIAIANPLKNINNNSNIETNEKVIQDNNFHYYIPNISLGINHENDNSNRLTRKGDNYVCFVIRHKGLLKIYKFVLTYHSIENILKYNKIKNNIDDFLEELNLAGMINIIYNTIQNKILPKYQDVYNLHISLDLMYCKGGLVSDDYIISKKQNDKCLQITNEFGYSYVGHYINCLSVKCEEIKKFLTNVRILKKRKTFYLDDYFKILFNIDFEDFESRQSTNQFIENLIDKEKKLYNTDKKRKVSSRYDKNTTFINKTFKRDLKNIFDIIQTLKKEDFSQSGSGNKNKNKNKKLVKNEKVVKNKKLVKNEKVVKNKKVVNNKKIVTKNKKIVKNEKVVNNKKVVNNEKVVNNKKIVTKNKKIVTKNKKLVTKNKKIITKNKK